jgi:serine/threonine protein kinase
MKNVKMLINQLVHAVSALHTPMDDKLVIHHDIKIENILIQINVNNEPILKLADFGCALLIGIKERIKKQHSGTESKIIEYFLKLSF